MAHSSNDYPRTNRPVPIVRPVTTIGENATLRYEADEYDRGPGIYIGASSVVIRDIGAGANTALASSNQHHPLAYGNSNNKNGTERDVHILNNPEGIVTLGARARIVATDQYTHATIAAPPVHVRNFQQSSNAMSHQQTGLNGETRYSQQAQGQGFYGAPEPTLATVFPQTKLFDHSQGNMRIGQAAFVAATNATIINQPYGTSPAPTVTHPNASDPDSSRNFDLLRGGRVLGTVLGEHVVATGTIVEVNHLPAGSAYRSQERFMDPPTPPDSD